METPPQPSGTPSSTNDDDHLAFRDISTTLDDTQPPRQPPQQLRIADITQWRDRDASCFSLRGNPQLSTGTHPNPSWRNTSEQDQRRRRHPKLCSPPQSTKQESRSRALEALEIIVGGATTVSVVWLHHHNSPQAPPGSSAISYQIGFYVLALAVYGAIGLFNIPQSQLEPTWARLALAVFFIAVLVRCVADDMTAMLDTLIVGGYVSLMLAKALRT